MESMNELSKTAMQAALTDTRTPVLRKLFYKHLRCASLQCSGWRAGQVGQEASVVDGEEN